MTPSPASANLAIVTFKETYDDRDDEEANAVHFQMVEEAMAGAEDKQKCQPPYG